MISLLPVNFVFRLECAQFQLMCSNARISHWLRHCRQTFIFNGWLVHCNIPRQLSFVPIFSVGNICTCDIIDGIASPFLLTSLSIVQFYFIDPKGFHLFYSPLMHLNLLLSIAFNINRSNFDSIKIEYNFNVFHKMVWMVWMFTFYSVVHFFCLRFIPFYFFNGICDIYKSTFTLIFLRFLMYPSCKWAEKTRLVDLQILSTALRTKIFKAQMVPNIIVCHWNQYHFFHAFHSAWFMVEI